VLVLLIGWGSSIADPTFGAPLPDTLPPLTVEQLQARLAKPIQTEAGPAIDLRRFTIDLSPQNQNFANWFYTRLQTRLQQAETPLGLDLSYSQIQGNFDVRRLGLPLPLQGQDFPPGFGNREQAELRQDRRRLFQLSQLSRSLLLSPIQDSSSPSSIVLQPLSVFPGTLNLVQTQFNGPVSLTNVFVLASIAGQGAKFAAGLNAIEARFSKAVNLVGAQFQGSVQFRNSNFYDRANFNRSQFQGEVTFQGAEFQGTANFSQSIFYNSVNFRKVQWQGNADLTQTRWLDTVNFDKGKFTRSLFLTEAIFSDRASFRESSFRQPVNLRGATVEMQLDFSDTNFAPETYLNLSGLDFDPDQAKLLGNPGQIGRVLSVPTLRDNENLLRNLVRNFRQLEQIADANQVEYTTQMLRLRELRQEVLGININTASPTRLRQLGFTPAQVTAILQTRLQVPFRSLTDLLNLDAVSLATYIKVKDRAIARPPVSQIQALAERWTSGLNWLLLSLLLLLSRYGTSTGLVFGVGVLTIANFGVAFWLIDRLRRFKPQKILPTWPETLWILSSFSGLTLVGLVNVFRTSPQPWLTLVCLGLLTVPVPAWLIIRLYHQGRYHDQMTTSYLVIEGTLRELRFLIGRLPVIPSYPFFRERYTPIVWQRRWNWLNYYDFSLNNLFKFGFNDIRLRDEHMPGLITTLAWYQWGLGFLYLALLLWTLSRTIPGLNLLIYFK